MKGIAISDIHLRDDVPVCRTDNFIKAQEKKIEFIRDIAHEINAQVFFGGDLFFKWNPSLYLVNWAMRELFYMIGVPGQHDMPKHNLELIDHSGYGILETSNKLCRSYSTEDIAVSVAPYGCDIPKVPSDDAFHILIAHKFVYQGKEPFPGAAKIGNTAKDMLKDHRYDLIITGDNHQTIIEEHKGRMLLNSGSMMRTTAAQIDHKPCFFVFDTDDITNVDVVYIPIEKGVVSREHISVSEERNARIDVFIERLNSNIELKLNFMHNLELFMSKNEVRPELKKKVWEIVGKEIS